MYVLFLNIDVTKSIACELQCDLKTKPINSLCVDAGNDSFKCVHFTVDKVPHDMTEYFIVFDKSNLFESIWDEFCDKLDKTSIRTFYDIYEHVWNQTIACCKDLLYKLYTKSFTHSDIERFVKLRNISFHVTTLYSAMQQSNHALVSLPDPKTWVTQAAKNVTMYLDFAKYFMQADSKTVQVNAIQLCLKLKELLRLKGNFSVVNNLHSQVCAYVLFYNFNW